MESDQLNNAQVNPLISVIIPTYNSESYLFKAVNSVINQDYEMWELLIVDNCSTDKTFKVASDFSSSDSRIKVIKLDHNSGGPAHPRNVGIEKAFGEYIAFLDSDDWWYEKKLSTILPYLFRHDVVYHDLDFYSVKGKRAFQKTPSRQLNSPIFVDLLTKGNTLATSSVCVRHSIIEKVKGFSELDELVTVEDYDCWLRISKLTEKFKYVPKILGALWRGESNLSLASKEAIERINTVISLHSSDLNYLQRSFVQATQNYMLGRTFQKMGENSKALDLLKHSLNTPNILLRLRAILFIIILHLLRLKRFFRYSKFFLGNSK